jgi:hypothetical protein
MQRSLSFVDSDLVRRFNADVSNRHRITLGESRHS